MARNGTYYGKIRNLMATNGFKKGQFRNKMATNGEIAHIAKIIKLRKFTQVQLENYSITEKYKELVQDINTLKQPIASLMHFHNFFNRKIA